MSGARVIVGIDPGIRGGLAAEPSLDQKRYPFDIESDELDTMLMRARAPAR